MGFITKKKQTFYTMIVSLTQQNISLEKRVAELEEDLKKNNAVVDHNITKILDLEHQIEDLRKCIDVIRNERTEEDITPEDLITEMWTGRNIEDIRAERKKQLM